MSLHDGIPFSVLAAVVLGIMGTAIATIWFYMLVKSAGAIFASLVTYGIPFTAIIWGFLYGESITLLEIICLALILAGVYLSSKQT
jgi:drug/metabolite transporter (DMT)-like permease